MRIQLRLPLGQWGWDRRVNVTVLPRVGEIVALPDGGPEYRVRHVVHYPWAENVYDPVALVVLDPGGPHAEAPTSPPADLS